MKQKAAAQKEPEPAANRPPERRPPPTTVFFNDLLRAHWLPACSLASALRPEEEGS
jgi:hypothetical protein